MRILVLGGAGAMASGTVRDLVASRSHAINSIIIADSSLERAKKLAFDVGDPCVQAAHVDVSDRSALRLLLERADLCINAVPTFAGHQMAIFQACFDARRTYVDYGGMGVFTVQQKKMAGAWERAGLTAVLGLGADPGISNMVCKAVAEQFDRIDRINLYWAAARLGSESPVLVPPYSISTLLAEYSNSSLQFLNGTLIEVPARSGHEVLSLPDPWGRTEFMYTQHSEPLTVPFANGVRDKGIREFTWKLHLPTTEHTAWLSLIKAGFGDFDDPITIKGATITPVEFLDAVLQRNIARNHHRIPEAESHEIRLAIGHGTRNGRHCTINQAVIVRPHPLYADYADPATSMGLSVGVQLMLKQPLKAGVWGPEEYFDVAPFFSELERRHFTVISDLEVEQLSGPPEQTIHALAAQPQP